MSNAELHHDATQDFISHATNVVTSAENGAVDQMLEAFTAMIRTHRYLKFLEAKMQPELEF